MKKVVSALTAAAMCASMAAGAASVFAYYDTPDMAFSLRAVDTGATGYTISEDGSTITFESAEAAANATFVVGHYLECDPSQVLIQQVGGCVTVSSPLVDLPTSGIDLGENAAYFSEAKEYTNVNGVTFSTNAFVNCFGYVNKLKKYKGGAAVQQWGHSSTWPEAWGYADKNEHLIWSWASSLDDTTYEDCQTTAHFITENSDDFPIMAFEVTLDAAITDGTYTIEWVDTYTNDYGQSQSTFFSAGSQNTPEGIPVMTPAGTMNNLTIVVGNAEDTTTAPTEDTTTAPVETGETTTESSDVVEPPVTGEEYTWDLNDATVDADNFTFIEAYVTNDPGTNGYTVYIEIEDKDGTWKNLNDFGLVYLDGSQGAAYPNLNSFLANPNESIVGATNGSDDVKNNQYAVEGQPVFTLAYEVPATIEDGVYNIRFRESETNIINTDNEKLSPVLSAGTLTIGDVGDTTEEPTTTTEAPTTTTEPDTTQSEDETTTTQAPDTEYLYGDVNKNGKVELVDIVMLNRYLTGYGDQQLDDYQMEVANCYYDDARDGKDSIEILKFLIGLTTALPTQAN